MRTTSPTVGGGYQSELKYRGDTGDGAAPSTGCTALDAGINFLDTADVYSAGESEEIVGKALKGGRDDIVLATKLGVPMDEDLNHRGGSRRWIITEVENSLLRLDTDWIDLYQLHRPDAHTDIDETLGALTDLVHQGKALYRLLFLLRRRDRRGTVERARAQPRALAHRAPALLDPRPRHRTRRAPDRPTARHRDPHLQPARRRLALRALERRRGTTSPARQRLVAPFDLDLPENQRKLEATQALASLADDAGISLIELAIAFVVNHPAVTSAIIGPRAMEQLDSQLPAADVTLDAAMLDRIDQIVRPGVNLNPADTSYGEHVLDASRRRR
jgi:aryl-alcohol dehydrogenase-like predicted oxidoreductase